MDKILNQEEIDLLFRAAQRRQREIQTSGLTSRPVAACNFRQASRISKDQLKAVSMLHETFARSLTRSLGAYLRCAFEANLVSAEQLTYGEYLQRVPEMTYMASLNVRPPDATMAVEIELPLAFPIIDSLLGGPGKPEPTVREITEIEEQILESVVKVIGRELQATWRSALEVEFRFDQRQRSADILRLMPPNEKILSLSFEIRMPEAQGMLTLILPATVSNALLRKLSVETTYRRPRASPEGSAQLRKRIERCRFPVELVSPKARITVSQLLGLDCGQVLALQHPSSEPGELLVAGKSMFTAFPVRSGTVRAAEIQRRLLTPRVSRKEKP